MFKKTDEVTNYVKIEMQNGDSLVIELCPEAAPVTVANFQKLVGEGFYDGLIFHRVIAGFMIQGGDPTGTGRGGSKQCIKGEFEANRVNNPLKHLRGVVSMARTNDPNSASSQFFICHVDCDFLDGKYAAFGKVVEGMQTVDDIANCPTDRRTDRPLKEQRMAHVYFVTKA